MKDDDCPPRGLREGTCSHRGAVDQAWARVNEADHLGQTPLHVAAQVGRVGVARFLLMNGADQNIKTAAGQDVRW